MLELAALGLLLKKPLHGYRLKKQLEKFMSGCISVNYGAIYQAIALQEHLANLRFEIEWLKAQIMREH